MPFSIRFFVSTYNEQENDGSLNHSIFSNGAMMLATCQPMSNVLEEKNLDSLLGTTEFLTTDLVSQRQKRQRKQLPTPSASEPRISRGRQQTGVIPATVSTLCSQVSISVCLFPLAMLLQLPLNAYLGYITGVIAVSASTALQKSK